MTAQWTLPTATSEYTVSLLPDGSGLVLDRWGAPVDGPVEPWAESDRFASFATAADFAPLEYASAGQRHMTFSELLVDRGDSRNGASWTCDESSIRFTTIDGATNLEVPFIDETGSLHLALSYATTSDHDVVRRSTTITNHSADVTVTLPRAFSGGWNVPVGQRARIEYLAGTWSNEFNRRHIDLCWGTFSIGSRQGVTGMLFSPVVTVTAQPDEYSFAAPGAGAFGVALEWSGSWRLQVDSLPVGQHVRVSCGVDDDTTTITLLPGESFTSPDTIGVWSVDGREGVSRAWQRYQRHALARSLGEQHRPIVYNSWYATKFDVRVEHQIELAAIARDLGVEVFVVDDGWFTGRTSDRAGLGDWLPDPAKFPNGLNALAYTVTASGMRFGIWIEPECVNPDSDLYRAHPDWIYRAADRAPVTIRNQYVLDLGRPEVVEWIEDTLRALLRSAPISYLKWDMNRPITDGGRPGDPHGREWSVQHTDGYYRVMRMLRHEFPEVTIEACASGGARIDNAVLALSDVVWPSDQVGPRDRLLIQHGFLSAYPPHVMSSWVADDRGSRDRTEVSFGYQVVVAMAGVLGIGADLLAWSPRQRNEAAQLITLYKDLRSVIHGGELTIHGDPSHDLYALEFAGRGADGRVVLLVYDRDRDRSRDREAPRVFPTSLKPTVRYRLRGTDTETTKAVAASVGVVVPFRLAVDTDVLVFYPVS